VTDTDVWTMRDVREIARTDLDRLRIDLMVFNNLPGSYERFAKLAEDGVHYCCTQMAKNPQNYSSRSEDEITDIIILQLNALGFGAVRDAMQGGHADLTISSANDDRWLGEAKIWRGEEYVYEGYLQLTTRYMTGDVRGDRGGVLIYCQSLPAHECASKWVSHVKTKHPDIKIDQVDDYTCCYRSSSAGSRTDRELRILHLAVPLLHAPRDKSARSRKKRDVKK
jgi:hypothetical protein